MSNHDTVAQVEIGTAMYNRFVQHVKNNQSISYYESTGMSNKCKYRILDAKEGFPGHVNFFLKRI